MKYSKRWTTFIPVLTVTALLVTISASFVQAQATTIVRAKIPFEFHAGNTILPAGTYTVRPSGSNGAISLSDGKGHVATVLTNAVPNRAAKSPNVAELLFSAYGDRHHFLGEVRWSGYSTARGIAKSGRELEIARLMPGPAKLMIAAN